MGVIRSEGRGQHGAIVARGGSLMASSRLGLAHNSPPTAIDQAKVLFLLWPGQSDGYTGDLCVKPCLVVRLPMGTAGYDCLPHIL